MCRLYLHTIYRCGCPGPSHHPGRTCSHYRHSLSASHSERGTNDLASRPCVSVVSMLRYRFACPRHRGSQDYWLSLLGWETNVSLRAGLMGGLAATGEVVVDGDVAWDGGSRPRKRRRSR